MTDPNDDPTPTELAEWRAVDLTAAKEWAAGRLARARQLGDVEVCQHLGNLVADVAMHEADLLKIEGQRADLAERLFAQEAELEALRAVADAARVVLRQTEPNGLNEYELGGLEDALDALPASCPVNTGQSPNGSSD